MTESNQEQYNTPLYYAMWSAVTQNVGCYGGELSGQDSAAEECYDLHLAALKDKEEEIERLTNEFTFWKEGFLKVADAISTLQKDIRRRSR